MKKAKDKEKEITVTGTMIARICSLIGAICSIICLTFELINTGDNIVMWIVLLLCNISLFFSVQNNKNGHSK